MKNTIFNRFIKPRAHWFIVLGIVCTLTACKEAILDEIPLSFFSPENVLVSKAGFEGVITALHNSARLEINGADGFRTHYSMQMGTDIAHHGESGIIEFRNYETTLTPIFPAVTYYWEWAYLQMLPKANTIIEYAEKSQAKWANEAEKNAIVAEARFFRAYSYNVLANLYGGVPIVDKVYTEPKLDFVRATRQEVLQFALKDLEFASQWLPKSTTQPGRIVKAAADHLMAEVQISLGSFDKSIEAASAVINDGQYKLMTQRFGRYASQLGDYYSDLFKDNNQNRPSGNQETIWAVQLEFLTPGGITAAGGNNLVRAWGPRYHSALDPDGKIGFVLADSMNRPVAWLRPTNYFFYDIWSKDVNDMRNSPYNIRRTFKYNNPASSFFNRIVTYHPRLDTTWHLFPTIRKIEGEPTIGNGSGRTPKDFYMMRLAETYLLRAEAHFRKGDLQKAADDINVVRSRAKAKPAVPSEITADFILDERARELITEEPRRRTLTRFGNLVARVKKFNSFSGPSIQDKHGLFPIPQTAIDANINAKLVQNPGY